jgi:hypothetical protein
MLSRTAIIDTAAIGSKGAPPARSVTVLDSSSAIKLDRTEMPKVSVGSMLSIIKKA